MRVRGAGKQRLYGLDARGLRPVHEWVGGFERFCSESFDRCGTAIGRGLASAGVAPAGDPVSGGKYQATDPFGVRLVKIMA